VRAGKLLAPAVSSRAPDARLPDAPTIAAGGFGDFEANQGFRMVAPVGTHPA
jgi:hypothetical protein